MQNGFDFFVSHRVRSPFGVFATMLEITVLSERILEILRGSGIFRLEC